MIVKTDGSFAALTSTVTVNLKFSVLSGTYFNCIMFMVASSVVTTIMVLNYHHRIVDTHEMPDWVKSLFLQWLPWLLRMSRYITAS